MMFLKAVSAARRTYPVITDGLKLYLDAYNIRSYPGTGTTWYDLSNSGYNFTNDGATWTVSGGRRYFQLDGVNDRIFGTNTTTLFDINTNGYTWSIWLNYATAPQFLDGIIVGEYTTKIPWYIDNRASDFSGGNGYQAGWYNESPTIQNKFTRHAVTVTTNVWRQLVYTFSYTTSTTATVKLYLAGAEVSTANISITGCVWSDANNSKRPIIGALYDGTSYSRFNNIRVSEVLQYNRPLSATEISDNYNSTKSNYGL